MKVLRVRPHLMCLSLLIGIAILFSFPQFQGYTFFTVDTDASKVKTQEIVEYQEKTGEKSYWSNSMFGGMPQGLMLLGREHNLIGAVTRPFYKLRDPARSYVRCMLFSFFALLLLRVNPWLALLGAVAYGFTVHHAVLIEAGHANKVRVLSLLPLIVSASLAIFKDQKWEGSAVLAASLSLAFYENHIQIIYYLFLMMLPLGIVLVVSAVRRGSKSLGSKILFLSVAIALSVGSNISQLLASQRVSQNSVRGTPILANAVNSVSLASTKKGLSWDSAMRFSNSPGDVLSLLVPRFVGGSSKEKVSSQMEIAQLMKNAGSQPNTDGSYMVNLYWGSLPFTNGPHYLGALLILLYALSWFWLPRHLSFGFALAILTSILLSTGDKTAFFNRPLFDYLPLFNKFRSPNSALSAVPFLVILPAILGLKELIQSDSIVKQKKSILKSIYLVGGLYVVLYVIAPSLLSFVSEKDSSYSTDILDVFIRDRKSLFKKDTLRAIFIALLASCILFMVLNPRVKPYLVKLLLLLLLVDLWGINKRYLDKDDFEIEEIANDRFDPRPVDQQILEMEKMGRGYYRVVDLSEDPFSSATSSYYHNSIGGYSAKKLQRYQDLIDGYLIDGSRQALSMLNCKYVIQQDGSLQRNSDAYGSAWLVADLQRVQTADEEFAAIERLDGKYQAVILASEFEAELEGFSNGDAVGMIKLSGYAPNRLEYQTSSESEQLFAFSEIWTDNGWKATIDGIEAPILRVNYLLRALRVEPGNHEIIFRFEPNDQLKYVNLLFSFMILGGLSYAGYQARRNSNQTGFQIESPAGGTMTRRTKKKKKRKKPKRRNKKD